MVSPLTHVKDKEAEGAKDDGSDLLPVDGESVPLRLVLKENTKQTIRIGYTAFTVIWEKIIMVRRTQLY